MARVSWPCPRPPRAPQEPACDPPAGGRPATPAASQLCLQTSLCCFCPLPICNLNKTKKPSENPPRVCVCTGSGATHTARGPGPSPTPPGPAQRFLCCPPYPPPPAGLARRPWVTCSLGYQPVLSLGQLQKLDVLAALSHLGGWQHEGGGLAGRSPTRSRFGGQAPSCGLGGGTVGWASPKT